MKKKPVGKNMSSAAWSIFRGGALIAITALMCAAVSLLLAKQNAVHIQNVNGFVKSLIDLACSSLLISSIGSVFINNYAEKAT